MPIRCQTLLTLCPVFAGLAGCAKGEKNGGDTPLGEVDCSTRNYSVPSTRGELDGVWDEVEGRLILFGGDQGTPVDCIPEPDFVGETWAFYTDCDNFEEFVLDEAPSMRSRHATALDATRRQMLVHGGRYREAESGNYTLYDDLWAFDMETNTWLELDAPDGPSARVTHGMVVAGDMAYVYGGNTARSSTAYNPVGDLWELDLTTLTWTELEDDAEPGERIFQALAVNEAGTKLYVYGGGDENAFFGPFFGDLWELDIESLSWTELHDGNGDAPDGRIWADLMVDEDNNALFLWAGHDDGSLGNTNQVWSFDLNSLEWTEVAAGDLFANPANGFCDFPDDFTEPDLDAPERRYSGAATLNEDGFIIFGGKTDCGQVNDVWTFDTDSMLWTERSSATAGEICARTFSDGCESLCF